MKNIFIRCKKIAEKVPRSDWQKLIQTFKYELSNNNLTESEFETLIYILRARRWNEEKAKAVKNPVSEINRVKYWWTEDGEIEICKKLEKISKRKTLCSHCFQIINEGTKMFALYPVEDEDTYHLCEECYKKATKEIEYRYNWRMKVDLKHTKDTIRTSLYYKEIEDIFDRLNLRVVGEGECIDSGQELDPTHMLAAIGLLMKKEWFKDNVEKWTLENEDGVEDLLMEWEQNERKKQ